MKTIIEALSNLPPAVYVMSAIVALYGLYELVKWIWKRAKSKKSIEISQAKEEIVTDYTIKSEKDFDLMRDAIWTIFSEFVANNDYDKVVSLVENWGLEKHPDFTGYFHELADLLETCNSINWQEYHLNFDALKTKANDIEKHSNVKEIEEGLTIQRIYKCLTGVISKRDFKE